MSYVSALNLYRPIHYRWTHPQKCNYTLWWCNPSQSRTVHLFTTYVLFSATYCGTNMDHLKGLLQFCFYLPGLGFTFSPLISEARYPWPQASFSQAWVLVWLTQYYKDGHMAKCIKWLQSGTDIKIEMLTMVYNVCVGYVIELDMKSIYMAINQILHQF